MAQIKEYYKWLGVEQNASDDEIKRAFRRLSKVHHPDISKEEDAQKRFEEVNEAYKTLSDPEMRAAYDEMLKTGGSMQRMYDFKYQDAFEMFFSRARTPQQPINGADVKADIYFTVYDAFHETPYTVPFKRSRACPDCHGKRYIEESKEICTECHGVGSKVQEVNTMFGRITRSQACAACKGYGKTKAKECTTCDKSGVIPEDATVTVTIPKGVWDGARKRIAGEGMPGKDGGQDGALIVTFVHRKNDRCRIENTYDVVVTESIDLMTALRGGEIDFVLPDGERTKVRVSPASSNGDRIVYDGKGLWDGTRERFGQCYIELSVILPRDLTDEQARRITQILAETNENPQ